MAYPFLTAHPLPLCPQSLLMKIDAFHYVQLGTAYRSVLPLPDLTVVHCSTPLFPTLHFGLRTTLH